MNCLLYKQIIKPFFKPKRSFGGLKMTKNSEPRNGKPFPGSYLIYLLKYLVNPIVSNKANVVAHC